ncbi:SNF2-related protein [Marimonas arenosa]|uniref:DEAD/DEAH box helicase n=1 Tax=Marimonas arenosa TaxID=1795305 RepID=A0AAE3WEJ8_9RHOB|nr:SNF2-related protein [Marimonas arenosa]MDQ2091154.1 DEAD/DEAH box helicase [Marimonas arenosa]
MSAQFTKFHTNFHANALTLSGTDDHSIVRTLTSARVEMNPHQVNAALFALKSPFSKGVLLADEVGLGKTIEAGLVISQRLAEGKRRQLLIVPASLRKQWQQELFEKFSIKSEILDSGVVRRSDHESALSLLKSASSPLIMSYEFAARISDEIEICRWDLAVLDEAHRLRNVYKNELKSGSSKRSQALAKALRQIPKILLTATPLQNSLLELYGLISIIDDHAFGGVESFRDQYVRAARDEVRILSLKKRLEPFCHRTLRRHVQEAGHINFRKRNALTFDFEPFEDEALLYEQVSEFLQRKDTISYGDRANALVLLQVRKILGSSTFAVARYLDTLISRLKEKKSVTTTMSDDIDIMDEYEDEDDLTSSEDEPIDPEQLKDEIQELQGMLFLANSIERNAKGEVLVSKLPALFEEIQAKGGLKKAVIFTESVRTQSYLNQLLSENGYKNEIVLLNGSNSDIESRAIYAAWKEKHAGTDRISGSRTADMKAALVEAFKSPEKSIMISTESGAEGINLQFCSVLINFDLPWNPQRIEQRIGRCHRYGQKIDVTVVNMLNRKNQTEARIFELLNEKFQLFDGVFGASDEVLGTIESGLDFEKTILSIVQSCRTEEEAEAEFEALKSRIQDRIDADIKEARAKVLEALDADVISKLHSRNEALAVIVPEYQQRLLTVARGELPDADFEFGNEFEFVHAGKTFTTSWSKADEHDWQFFRVNDGLGAELVQVAKERELSDQICEMTFYPSEFPFAGRAGAIEALRGKSGWLRVFKAIMPTSDENREELLSAIFLDDGTILDGGLGSKMMAVPSSEPSECLAPPPDQLFSELEERIFGEFSTRVQEENLAWLEEEEARLDQYAKDVEIELDAEIALMEEEIKELQRERRDPKLSMQDKLNMGRKIKRLEGDVDDLKLSKFERRKKIRREVSDKLDEFADLLNQQPTLDRLFTVRWRIA